MGGLTIVVGAASVGIATFGYACRRALPTPALVLLGQASITGMLISLAASDPVCNYTTWLIGKDRKTGDFRPWVVPLFWPFFLGLHLRINARRRRTSEPLYNKVADGWYVGGWPDGPDKLPAERVAVVDCTCEFANTHDAPYINVPCWDTQEGHALAVEFALKQRAEGRPVFVHCAHGHGRSVGVLCACLVMSGEYGTYQEALAATQAARPKARLNRMQVDNLVAYLAANKKYP